MTIACSCDYEPCTLYKAVIHRSRVERRCEECARRIRPGDRYERVDGLYAGDWFSSFTCEPCLELRQWVKNSVPCFCWAHGSMIDDAAETVKEAADRARGEVDGLMFGFLRRLWRVQRWRRGVAAPAVQGGLL